MAKKTMLALSYKNKEKKNTNDLSVFSSEYDYLFRINIVGDKYAGKTALLRRFVDDTYDSGYYSVLAADRQKVRNINTYEKRVKLIMYDMQGKEELRKSHAYMFVFDVSDAESFNTIKIHIDSIEKNWDKNRKGEPEMYPSFSQTPIILVGNKVDLLSQEGKVTSEALAFIDELEKRGYNIAYSETSAKTDENVEDTFINLTQMCLEKYGVFDHSAPEQRHTNRQKLIDQLKNYINRIEEHKSGGAINFSYGFRFYADSRACNREANYHLAKKLQIELLDEKKSLQDIFNNGHIAQLRLDGILANNISEKIYYKDRGINSKELNNILKEAAAMIDSDNKQACPIKGP